MNESLEIPIEIHDYEGGYAYHSLLCEKSLYESFSNDEEFDSGSLFLFDFKYITLFYLLQPDGLNYLVEGEEIIVD